MSASTGSPLLWPGFIVSLVFAIMASFMVSFTAFALLMKNTFQLTQTQVEIISSMGSIGTGLGFLESILRNSLGRKVTCFIPVVGLPLVAGTYTMMAHYNQFFHHHQGFLYAIHLCLCTVGRIAYFSISGICIENFSKEHTGKIVGAYLAFSAFGKIYYSAVIQLFFKDNLTGFFLCLTIVTSMLYVGSLVLLLAKKSNSKETDSLLESQYETENQQCKTKTTTTEVLKSPFFHMVFWLSNLFYSMCQSCLSNLTSIAESVGTTNPMRVVYVLSGVVIVTRLVFGVIFDKFLSLWCGYALLLLGYLSFCIAMVIGVFFLDSNFMFAVAVAIAIAIGLGMSIPLAIIFLRFGRVHYGAIASLSFTVVSVGQSILQLTVGYFYDFKIIELGLKGRTCYGRDCFYWSFVIMCSITMAVICLQTLNFVLSRKTFERLE